MASKLTNHRARGSLLLTVATLMLSLVLVAGCSDSPVAPVTPDTPDTPTINDTRDLPGPLKVESPDNAPGEAPAGPAQK